ncbi:YqeB family protein [Nucisporomicrobium flavum]|uniref:YqeB family protein n=1 Tax=Nucisporomicrobium flavum TaxID=2785915 RepID=UPI0018F699E4|nr:hypothetical protein [Nucisporomicrobium flavum]
MIDERTVATPAGLRVAVWLGLAAIGGGLGWVVHELPGWLLRIPFVPLRGPLRFAAGLPEPAATVVTVAVGTLLGLALAWLVDKESLTVRITGTDVVLIHPGVHRTVPRAEVAVAYRERDELVLLGSSGRELAREPLLVGGQRLAELFGAAWTAQDPYAASYRRWVPGLPDVPAEAEALLTARQKALADHDTDDARQLRQELARLGFVLRDEKRRQFFRQAP